MVDTTIPHGTPGIASFASETWGGPNELLYGDTPALAVTHHTIYGLAGLELPIYSVVAENGALATVSGAVQASGTVTFSSAAAADGDTVTIGGKTYTFRTALTDPAVPNEVLAGANVTASATNLVAAIMGTAASEGTLFSTGTVAHDMVTASNASGVVTVTAIQFGTVGNAITLAEVGTNIAVSGAVLASGANPTSNAFGILAAAVDIAAGEAISVPMYRAGHFNMLALNFHSSFDTDVEKQRAFQYSGSPSPTILISKPQHLDSHVNI
jgi:hypothetical protein